MTRKRTDRGSVHGLVGVHKPVGPTSHDVMRQVQRTLGASRSGHAGTLDPGASGLLVVLLGEATKLSRWAMGCDKTYVARIALGRETDTLDAAGEVTDERPVPDTAWEPERVRDVLVPFLGEQDQLPPVYSAIKRDGRSLMSRARAGETPEVEPRRVRCDALELLAITDGELVVRVASGSGYYVRSLARDVAVALGTVGHLAGLVRERVGPWGLEGAPDPEEVTLEHVTGVADALPFIPKVTVDAVDEDHVRHGRAVQWALEGEVAMAISQGGEPLAVLSREADDRWTVTRGFRLPQHTVDRGDSMVDTDTTHG